MRFSKREIIISVSALIIGLIIGKFALGTHNEENEEGHNHNLEQLTENGITIWTCSMHPQIRQSDPGNCPICGMELIPADNTDAEEEASDPNEIQMSEAAIKLAEVQTVQVKRGIPDKSVFLLGKVQADERNIAELTARFGGRIEKLFVNYTGQNVQKGQMLATIYSPDLITAQRELLEASQYKKDNPSFYRAARTKLKLWDLSEQQIDDIEKKGEPKTYFDILSPISGTVTRRDVAVGDYVKEGNPLFEVIDLSRIWVMFDAYESDLPWIKNGDEIKFSLQSLPGKTYSGKVSYIDPFIDARTRVAKVRVEMANPGLMFKPEMFANGILDSKISAKKDALLIPKTAILWTGKRAVVYVKVPNRKKPTFIYRQILLGPEAGNFYVVADGLKEGEVIATNGVFKIDASAQLAGKASMMNPSGGKVNTGHNHGGSTMTDEEMAAMNETEADKQKKADVQPTEQKDQEMDMEMDEAPKKEADSDMKCEAGKCGQ